MRDAVAGLEDSEALYLDFYDRTRMATWVTEHPGVVLWVRNRTGHPLSGWKPYGNWSNAPEGGRGEYLSDDTCRLRDLRRPEEGTLTIAAGIARLRSLLSAPGGLVRLTGLSGTGKTRLLEALFDGRIGEHPLDPAHAVYVDIGREPPVPSAGQLASRLVAEGKRTILVIDNCPRDTHDALAPICAAPDSTLSLISVTEARSREIRRDERFE